MKKLLVSVVCAASICIGLTGAHAHHRPNKYCADDGKICMTTEMDGGQRKLRVTTNGHPFSRYKLCVTAPDKSRVCKKFEMQKFGEYYTSTVYWAESYPNKGAGAYTVRWMKRGALLGRALGFHVK